MSDAERVEAGINSSAIHIDMMIGGPEVDVTGVRADGRTATIIEQGAWALPLAGRSRAELEAVAAAKATPSGICPAAGGDQAAGFGSLPNPAWRAS